MAAKSSKAKSKHRPTAKSKTKLTASSPLLAAAPAMRTAKLTAREPSNEMAGTIPFNPALMMIELMSRALGAYAELPGRLAQCRSPMDLWAEQARFAQRVFNTQLAGSDQGFPPPGTGRNSGARDSKGSAARETVSVRRDGGPATRGQGRSRRAR
jgi:hypothetical protein